MDSINPLPKSKSQNLLISKVGGVGEDRISKLPDDILVYVLSFLPIKDILRACTLSTRWKHIWKCISEIDFDEFNYAMGSRQWTLRSNFLNLVERVVVLNDSSCMRKLRLNLYDKNVSLSHVYSWVSAAVNNKVEALDLRLSPKNRNAVKPHAKTPFVLPDSLFTCASLRSLKLNLRFEVPSLALVHFLNLKILTLFDVAFPSDQVAEQLFSGCPVLGELSLYCCNLEKNQKITISVPTLRIFNISDGIYKYDCLITIAAENLLSLECFECLTVIDLLLCDLRSLRTAYISSYDCEDDWEDEKSAKRAVDVFRGIHNVKSLTLPASTLEVSMYLSLEVDLQACLPTYHSLTHLKLEFSRVTQFLGGLGVMSFLRKSPNLESLVIDKLHYTIDDWLRNILPHFDTVPQCFTSSLKTVAISIYQRDSEMPFFKYLLENAIMLECIKISCADSAHVDFVKQEINRLLEQNRMGSSSCSIEFYVIGSWWEKHAVPMVT